MRAYALRRHLEPAPEQSRVIRAAQIRGALLPMGADLSPCERVLLGWLTATLMVLVAATGLQAFSGLGGPGAASALGDWVTPAVYILVGAIVSWRALRSAEARQSWLIFAAGLLLYGLGNIVWTLWFEDMANPPIPSICDVAWLALYPCSYIGLIGLAQIRERRVPARLWLDALIAALGVSALGAAFLLGPVLDSVSGNTAAVMTELAYPLCDLLLVGIVVGVLALRSWRLDRLWGLLGAGFIALAAADLLYAVQVAGGATSPSGPTNFAYDLGVAALALACWQRSSSSGGGEAPGVPVLAIPAAFTSSALGLLVYDHFARLDLLALILALGTIVAGFARTGAAFIDVRTLAATRHEALTDELTSLPNRRHFLGRLRREIAGTEAEGGQLALMIIDLDHFKELNDTLGHDAGDRLLREVGIRMRACLRTSDIAARLGGDEFGVLVCGAGSAVAAETVAQKILRAIGAPLLIDALSLRVTASIGIALYPEHAGDDRQLMQHADVAMYEAKAAQSGYALYARERDNHSPARLTLAGELSHALQAGQIVAHFQPKADASSGRIVGLEAMARWQHPVRGLIGPSEFVGVAEQAGLGRALTRRMLELALEQLARWRAAGLDLHVAVNTTVADLQDTRFPAEVTELLHAAGLEPGVLILEVTENVVLADPVRVGDVLARLGELGIGIALDDFGTGFSSLTHLKVLPVGELKIDRSFVAQMITDRVDAAIVNATIKLAHGIGIRVVAEGVENQDIWGLLDAAGCELVQGETVSMPRPAAELSELLQSAAPLQPERPRPASSSAVSRSSIRS